MSSNNLLFALVKELSGCAFFKRLCFILTNRLVFRLDISNISHHQIYVVLKKGGIFGGVAVQCENPFKKAVFQRK
jgi:hypothetical protein